MKIRYSKIAILGFLSIMLTTGISAQWDQLGTNIEGAATYEYYGRALEMSRDGNVVAIGSQANPENLFLSTVDIYKFSAGDWVQIGSGIKALDGDNSDAIALNANGSIVAIGSIRNGVVNGQANYEGHVKVFKNVLGNWEQIGVDIIGSGGGAFGEAVSLSADGSVVVIGAHFNSDFEPNAGQVQVYRNKGGNWEQIGSDLYGDREVDNFGFSVDVNNAGTIIAIGAPFNDSATGVVNSSDGQVKVYRNNNDIWEQVGADILGGDGDSFGYGVSLNDDGTTLAISAIRGASANAFGFVRVYENINDSWQVVGDDIEGEEAADLFGVSLSLNGNGSVVAVGASLKDGDFGDMGYAKIYSNNGGNWVQVDDDIYGESEDDSFGKTVCLSADGSKIAISGYLNDDNGFQAGRVRVFENTAVVKATDELSVADISIYPNPSSGEFYIENGIDFNVKITGINGAVLYTSVIKEAQTIIDLKNRLSSGIYLIYLESDTQYFVGKCVVE